MGCQDLSSILKQGKETLSTLKDLDGLRLSVDIECWFHKAIVVQAYFQSYHMLPPVPLTQIGETVLKLHTLLTSFNIKPVYVIGGKKHIGKKDVDDARAALVAAGLEALNTALMKDVDIHMATCNEYKQELNKLRKNAAGGSRRCHYNSY